MIVDCYTHIWEADEQLGKCRPDATRHTPFPRHAPQTSGALPARHHEATAPVDRTIIVGFKTKYLGAEVSNDQIAGYINTAPDALIGFAGIDPSNPTEAIDDLHHACEDLSFKGIAVAPAAQDIHPAGSHAMLVYTEAERLGLPVLFHPGVYIARKTKLEYARPVLLDEVARDLPDLKIIIAHMGFPWVQETIALLAKHDNVYAEVSWVLSYPWHAYNSLVSAHEFGVMDRLLFGSGFPFNSAKAAIEMLYGINHIGQGGNLPTIPTECLRNIVERDTLALLGIKK